MGLGDWFGGKKGKFRDLMKDAVKDGKLTPEKLAELETARAELEADHPSSDKTIARREIFNTAVDAVKSGGKLDSQQEKDLAKIQKFLALRDDQIDKTRLDLRRLKSVEEIRKGNLPQVSAQNAALRGLALAAGEVAHFCSPADLFERPDAGPDAGVRFHADAPYEPGSSRGHELPVKDAKALADGFVIVTNRRFIFKGGRTLGHELSAPESFYLYEDGVRLPAVRAHYLFKLRAEGQSEVVGALLTHLKRA